MDQWNQQVLGLSFYEVLGEKWVLICKNHVKTEFLVKNLFSIWHDIWSEMEGLGSKLGYTMEGLRSNLGLEMEGLGSKLGLGMGVRDQLGTKTSESLCAGQFFFFSAKKVTSRFLGMKS